MLTILKPWVAHVATANLGLGATVTSSGDYGSGYEAAHANDSNIGTPWASGTIPAWLQFDLGTAHVVNKYSFYAQGSGNNQPTDWTLFGSNTGAFTGEQTILDSRASQDPADNSFTDYYFSNTTAYRYYRWIFTASIGTNNIVQLNEVELRRS